MRFLCVLSVITLVGNQLPAQTDGYWQQRVDYRIEVTLDDSLHTLTGHIEIDYHNNSPDTLREIWMHLWANAFSRHETAFDRQKRRTGDTRFYFATPEQRGGYSGLDFRVNGQPTSWQLQKQDPDIARLTLPQPLLPGQSVRISTPFTLKIPDSFSRLGHVGTSYQMTQWYPKPAVYDRKGWHPMPYLDMGEFYSEFGSFDVRITLPANYVVGATGVLQNPDERQWLLEKDRQTRKLMEARGFPSDNDFPPSASLRKTLHYTADDVHDFAWFADKRFHVLHGEVTLPSGRTVETWTMFTNEQAELWRHSIEYVNRAVAAYSEWVGEYPWPHATAVQSALSAGAGMEYPMITVIGKASAAKDLDQVIAHEVGHNWFYGILATNERDHPWMDEGINTFYEYRYTTAFWGARVVEAIPRFLTRSSDADFYEIAYLYNARRRLDQAPETTSDAFAPLNYGLASYIKTGLAFRHLEGWLGRQAFDEAMQAYYRQWQFRHPYPEDLQAALEKHTGRSLGWLFDGYIGSNAHYDYAINGAKHQGDHWSLTLCNCGEIPAPVPVVGVRPGGADTVWYDGFEGCKQVSFPAGDFEQFAIDPAHLTLDVQRKNNYYRPNKLLPRTEPLKPRLAGFFENSRYTTLNFFPLLGANKYDGTMVGLLFHNGLLPPRHFNIRFAGLYGLKSGYTPYLGRVEYRHFPKNEKWQELSFGITAKSFTNDYRQGLNFPGGIASEYLRYRRIAPYLYAQRKPSPTSSLLQRIHFTSIAVSNETLLFDENNPGVVKGTSFKTQWIHRLSLSLCQCEQGDFWSLALGLEQSTFDFFDGQHHYLRTWLEGRRDFEFDYKREFSVRFYIGAFIDNSLRRRGIIGPAAFNLTAQGFNDYSYDDFYFGRNESEGLLSQQIALREGGMKVALGSPFSEGRSNDFIIALNLWSDLPHDLPGKLPIRPYFDIGYYSDKRPISSGLDFSDQLWWQGGFSISNRNRSLAVFFPVISSRNVKDLYDSSGRNTFWKRITFTIDLTRADPWWRVEHLNLF